MGYLHPLVKNFTLPAHLGIAQRAVRAWRVWLGFSPFRYLTPQGSITNAVPIRREAGTMNMVRFPGEGTDPGEYSLG